MAALAEGALWFNGLTRHQPHLLGSAIQSYDELSQKVHKSSQSGPLQGQVPAAARIPIC